MRPKKSVVWDIILWARDKNPRCGIFLLGMGLILLGVGLYLLDRTPGVEQHPLILNVRLRLYYYMEPGGNEGDNFYPAPWPSLTVAI